MINYEDIDEEIAKLIVKSNECEEYNYDRDQFNNPYRRSIKRLRVLKELLETDAKVEEYGEGVVLINDNYVYALKTGKWKIKGKNKWYYSGSPKSFVEKFAN